MPSTADRCLPQIFPKLSADGSRMSLAIAKEAQATLAPVQAKDLLNGGMAKVVTMGESVLECAGSSSRLR
jgi:hypothetical protein